MAEGSRVRIQGQIFETLHPKLRNVPCYSSHVSGMPQSFRISGGYICSEVAAWLRGCFRLTGLVCDLFAGSLGQCERHFGAHAAPDLCKIRLLGILISNVRSEDRWKDRGTIDLRRVCAVGFGKRAYLMV